MGTKFQNISISNWRQFKSVDIAVHPRLTIITGSNGAGKSTILNLFSQHFGSGRPFLATPRRSKSGQIVYDLGYYTKVLSIVDEEAEEPEESSDDVDVIYTDEDDAPAAPHQGSFVSIGAINYDNGTSSSIGYQEQQASVFGITIQNQQAVAGVQIGSHRTISAYQPVQGISFQALAISQAYAHYFNELNARMTGGNTQFSPVYRMKEALIAMAAFGEGNSHLQPNEELLKAFNGFILILKKVLPRELGFQKLLVRPPDIVIKAKSGEFILDASSGGVSAIIEIAWQMYLFSLSNDAFVATIDEPENHLHPSMQRSLLSNLITAFPQVQFVVATHSPFVVSAVEDSFVYALKYVGSKNSHVTPKKLRRVQSICLDQTKKAGTASEILREVLGVNVTIPDWAQDKLDKIIERYEGASLDAITLGNLRRELMKAGFSEFYPEALSKLVKDR